MAESNYLKSLPFLIFVGILLTASILGLLVYAVVSIDKYLSEISESVKEITKDRGVKHVWPRRREEDEIQSADALVQITTVTRDPRPADAPAQPSERSREKNGTRKVRFVDEASDDVHSARSEEVRSASITEADVYDMEEEEVSEPRKKSRGALATKMGAQRHGIDENIFRPAPGTPRHARAALETGVAKDATVLGTTLYVLNEKGEVYTKSLLTNPASREKTCRIEVPPEPLASIDAANGRLLALSESGKVYTLSPCSDPGCKGSDGVCQGKISRWVNPPRKRALGDGEARDVDFSNVRHLSISPDGTLVWLQDDAIGRLYDIADSGEWIPSGKPLNLGSDGLRRVIGDGGDFVDLMDGKAVRNRNIDKVHEGVKNVVYPDKHIPIFTEAKKKRVTAGRVSGFPCHVDSLLSSLVA